MAKALVSDLQGEMPPWGYSASPLLKDEKLIVQPGEANTRSLQSMLKQELPFGMLKLNRLLMLRHNGLM